MSFRDLLYETWQALLANKTRNLLTVLGIVIGIAAVIAMTALIDGIRNSIYSEMGLDQSRLIEMYVTPSDKTFGFDDVDMMEKNLSGYEFVGATKSCYSMEDPAVHADDKEIEAFFLGVESEFLEAMQVEIITGNSFSESDMAAGAKVAVIDKNSAVRLFTNESDAVGKTITYGKEKFTIVGVSSASANVMQSTVYIPLKTAVNLSNEGVNAIPDEIFGFANEGYDIPKLVEETRAYIGKVMNIDPDEVENYVFVTSMEEMIAEVDSFMGMFQALMTAVASISLLVGGIGIMNMMLTNVTERIREIGLRKALGAHKSNIIVQFLMESIMLTLAGGVIGTIFGYGGSWLLAGFAGELLVEGASITPVVSPLTAFVTATICIVIGVVFGLYPASRAAKLDPVESLRHQ